MNSLGLIEHIRIEHGLQASRSFNHEAGQIVPQIEPNGHAATPRASPIADPVSPSQHCATRPQPVSGSAPAEGIGIAGTTPNLARAMSYGR